MHTHVNSITAITQSWYVIISYKKQIKPEFNRGDKKLTCIFKISNTSIKKIFKILSLKLDSLEEKEKDTTIYSNLKDMAKDKIKGEFYSFKCIY